MSLIIDKQNKFLIAIPNIRSRCIDHAAPTSVFPYVYFSYFLYLPQAEKVPILKSTTYLKKEIPSTF
jgi:hypothetical protein